MDIYSYLWSISTHHCTPMVWIYYIFISENFWYYSVMHLKASLGILYIHIFTVISFLYWFRLSMLLLSHYYQFFFLYSDACIVKFWLSLICRRCQITTQSCIFNVIFSCLIWDCKMVCFCSLDKSAAISLKAVCVTWPCVIVLTLRNLLFNTLKI